MTVTGGVDPIAPLWRSAQAFRLLSCVYALGFQIAVNSDLQRSGLAWLLFAVLLGWSAVCAVVYLQGFGRRPWWVIAEVVVTIALVLSTDIVASRQWELDNQSWPTTLWASNATVSAALQFGPGGGMLTAVAVMTSSAFVKGYIDINLGRSATIVIEMALGLAVGMAAQTARRAHEQLQRAGQLAAAVDERDRLSRHIHDGVIQVLALVTKRGHEIGGATAELAELASEQERALRRFVNSSDITVDSDVSTMDLRTLLSRREDDRVSVSLPATAVSLERYVATELDAAVGNAVDNARLHAGDGTHVFVLLEDLGESVTVSVRDNGVGIAAGRLAEACRQGHLGVSKSIVGRMKSLHGSAELHTSPGEGTEWELSVRRRDGHHD